MPKVRKPRETPEVAKGVARLVKALGRRVGEEDPIDLQELQLVKATLMAAERAAVARMRERGYSWGEIAEGLGTTRQNAQQRFADKKGQTK